MAEYAGVGLDPFLVEDEYAMISPRFAKDQAFPVPSDPVTADDYQDGGAGGITPPDNSLAGLVATAMTPGHDWFDKVHILPRTKIEFGNIVTDTTAEFEIFNANRVTVVMTDFINNAGAGITIPNLPSIPFEIAALTSVLDPSSTRLNPVRLDVVADSEGVATFDSSLEFEFATLDFLTTFDVELLVSGTRVVLFSFVPEWEFDEDLDCLVDILSIGDGDEQRIAPRDKPRQVFSFTYQLDGHDRRRMHVMLAGWQARFFGVPLWHEQILISAAAVATDTLVQVASTDYIDFRVGGLALVWQDEQTYDVLTVAAITATEVQFESELQNSYDPADGVVVVPVRVATIRGPAGGGRPPKNLERFTVVFHTNDNETGAPDGSVAAYDTFEGKALVDLNILHSGDNQQQFLQELTLIDNEVGNVYQVSDWPAHRRVQMLGFHIATRQDLWNARQLIYALNGPQVSFWLPTFDEDLEVTQPLVMGNSVMDIRNIGYTRFIEAQHPKNKFRITFTDGTQLTRTISSSTELSVDEERLTLDDSWPAGRDVDEIELVEFLENVRFDTQSFRFRHHGIGKATLEAPVKVVLEG